MKIYLYFQRYELCKDLEFRDDELKGLYAWTTDKEIRKKFECTRYMGAFKRKVIHEEDLPDYNLFTFQNRDLQLIELPVQTRKDPHAVIIGTYKEDNLITDLIEVTSNYLDDINSEIMELVNSGYLTPQGENDLKLLLNFKDNTYGTDVDVFHMFYQTFTRSFVSPKIWQQLEKIHYESEEI